MAIKNLVSSSYNYATESYNSSYMNWSLEDEAENKTAADVAVIDADTEVDSAEHAANAADALSGVLEVADANDGEVTENEASLIEDVNTAVAGTTSTPEDSPVVVSSESNGRYYISKEGIVDKIKEIWKRIKEAIMKVWDKLKDAYKKYFGTYKSIQKRAEKIKKRAEDMSGKTIDKKTIEYENNVAMLYHGDKKMTTSTELLTGLKACETLVNLKEITTAVKISELMNDVVDEYDGRSTDDSKMLALVDKLITEVKKNSNGTAVTPFVGFKKIYVEKDGSTLSTTGSKWETDLGLFFRFKARVDDFSDAKLSPKITFSTMPGSDVEKVCDKVIEIAKECILISSSAGIDKLLVRKDKLKDASDRLEKRHQSSIKDDDTHDSGISNKFTSILKLNTFFASYVTTITKKVSLTGTFMGVCLTLSEKSLDNYKSK